MLFSLLLVLKTAVKKKNSKHAKGIKLLGRTQQLKIGVVRLFNIIDLGNIIVKHKETHKLIIRLTITTQKRSQLFF